MSIPRAKITRDPIRGMFESRPNCGCIQLVFVAESIDMASDLTRGHFWEDHGVRTVGSLTADDIGKWIELDEREPFKLDEVWQSRRDTSMFVANSGPRDATAYSGLPHGTPCRVTEERP